MKLKNKKSFLFVAILGLFLTLAFALVPASAGRASPTPVLDDKTLIEKALAEAEMAGLISKPYAQKFLRMNLDEWNTLVSIGLGSDAEQFGLTPDIPVFILAIRGNVEWRGPGLPRPGQELPEYYDNITVVLDARTGDLIWTGSYNPNQPMPISIL